ncbi:MAG: hypothetical protein ACK5MG_10710 [Bacteroidales bacterium]
MRKIIYLIVLFPLISFAQIENESAAQATLEHNNDLLQYLAQLAPMSVNPYTSVFATSIFSKLGFHSEYISTHPFYNSWIVLVVFGILFLFTLTVRPAMASNQLTGTLVKIDNWLENKAGLLINSLVILLPVFFSSSPLDSEIVYQAGFLSISFKTVLILFVSTYLLLSIMTMFLFVDFLIFLSPVPLVDTVLQISKIFFSIILVVVSILSPIVSVAIMALLFIASLFFLDKAMILINKMNYLMIYPILNSLRGKEKVLSSGDDFSILVLIKESTHKFKKGSILRLEKRDARYFMVKTRMMIPNKEEEIILDNPTIQQTHVDSLISCNSEVQLILNRSYHKHIDEISEELNAEIIKRASIDFLDKKRISMFSKNDIKTLRTI